MYAEWESMLDTVNDREQEIERMAFAFYSCAMYVDVCVWAQRSSNNNDGESKREQNLIHPIDERSTFAFRSA